MTKKKKEVLFTPPFKVLWPEVFTPKKPMNGTGEPKYSIMMAFPKDFEGNAEHKEMFKAMKKAIDDLMIEAFGEKDTWSESVKYPIKDGDKKTQGGKYPVYENCWLISANTQFKPNVVDHNVNPILSQEDFYPGCIAQATVFADTFDMTANKGGKFHLEHIQKIGDGKRVGGGVPVENRFAPVNGVASSTVEDFDNDSFDE